MSLEELSNRVEALYSPHSDPTSRHAADHWIQQFRQSSDPSTWTTAFAAASGQQNVSPLLRVVAAQILATKAREQLHLTQDVSQRLETANSLAWALASAPSCSECLAATSALCIALANALISVPNPPVPLEILAPVLPPPILLEFLTILPAECEDRWAAWQRVGSAARDDWGALEMKLRSQEWSVDIGRWMCQLHASTSTSEPRLDDGECTVRVPLGTTTAASLDAAIARCFAAWTKWGCLFHMHPGHYEYLIGLSGNLMLAGAHRAGFGAVVPGAAVGAEALLEAIEHAPESTHGALLRAILPLPSHISNLVASKMDSGPLLLVYATYLRTNAQRAANFEDTAEEAPLLRNGVLQLLHLPGWASCVAVAEDGEDEAVQQIESFLSLLDAVGDIIEAINAGVEALNQEAYSSQQQGEQRQKQQQGNISFSRQLEIVEFVRNVVAALLHQVRAPEAAFSIGSPYASTASDGFKTCMAVHAHLRAHAQGPLEAAAHCLGPERFADLVHGSISHAAGQHGATSVPAQQRIDACVFVLGAGAPTFLHAIEKLSPMAPQRPPWTQPLLSVFSAAHNALLLPSHDDASTSSPSSASPATPLSLLRIDMLTAFSELAPSLMRCLASVEEHVRRQFVEMILHHAYVEMAAPSHVLHCTVLEDTYNAGQAAAGAVRALFACAHVASLTVSADMIRALDAMLAAVLAQAQPATQQQQCHLRRQVCSQMSRQLMVAAVHAAHAVLPSDGEQALNSLLRDRAFQPMLSLASTMRSGVSRVSVQQVQSCLENMNAVLGAFESHLDDAGERAARAESLLQTSTSRPLSGPTLAERAMHASVSAFLTAWSQFSSACCVLAGTLPTGAGDELFAELSACMGSCLRLQPAIVAPGMGSVLETCMNAAFIPRGGGGFHMCRIVCMALETYGSAVECQPPLLASVSALLSHERARKLATLRGCDVQPDIGLGALSIATSLLREMRRWAMPNDARMVEASIATVHRCLELASANVACHHRAVSQRALNTLSASVALMLDESCALHAYLLLNLVDGYRHGITIVKGTLLAVAGLQTSTSMLPKIAALVCDLVSLVVVCCRSQQRGAQQQLQTPQQSIAGTSMRRGAGNDGVENHSLESAPFLLQQRTECALALLQEWMMQAYTIIAQDATTGPVSGGDRPALEASMFQKICNFEWQNAIRMAGASESNMAAARRHIQRQIREFAAGLST